MKVLSSALKKIVFLISLLALFFTSHTTQPGLASSTFTVNSSADAGDATPGDGMCATHTGLCTLRSAIDETNQLAGPNTIIIPAMTIVLNSELRIEDHVGDDSVNIMGAGRDLTIIDGNFSTRVLYFAPRSGTHSVSDLTIRNASNQYPASNISERNGGGIFNEANLTLTNVTVTNSRAFTGGGVYNQHAFWGPAGENVPSMTLNSVTLTNNTATAMEDGYGGGGLFNGSELFGNDVTITNNHAETQGGGFYNNSDYTAHLINFSINNNVSKYAAGVNNDLGTIILEDGAISDNTSECCGLSGEYTGGAGIYNNQGNMNITNVVISANKATSAGGYGGGIYNAEEMTLTNVSVINNQAAYGAGIMNGNYYGGQNQLTLTNITISGNQGKSSSSPRIDAEGGAIFNISNGKIWLYNATITQNSASVGGGITTRNDNTLVTIHNSILANNLDDWGVTDCRGELVSTGYNIIGNPFGNPDVNPGFACVFSLKPTDMTSIDPNLGPLTGYLSYHPLLSISPAINQGTNIGCPDFDQIGTARPVDSICDIGAIEQPNPNQDAKLYLPILIKD